MTISGEGNNGGDPARFCDELRIGATSWHEAMRVAQLLRVLRDPQMRDELFDAAEYIEAQKNAHADPVLG